jgi:hypothetical protein
MQRLRMNGTITLLPFYTFTVQKGTVRYLLYKFNLALVIKQKSINSQKVYAINKIYIVLISTAFILNVS